MSARDELDVLLQRGREQTAAALRKQTAGPCDNPLHRHERTPLRIFFCGYWLCPLDEVRSPKTDGPRIIPVGELTTNEIAKINRHSGVLRRRRR